MSQNQTPNRTKTSTKQPAIPDSTMLDLLNDIKQQITANNNKIDTISEKFDALESKLDTINSRLTTVEVTTKELEKEANHTSAELSTVHNQISNLLKKDTARDNDHISLEHTVTKLRAELKGIYAFNVTRMRNITETPLTSL